MPLLSSVLPSTMSVTHDLHVRMAGRGLCSDVQPGEGGCEQAQILQSPRTHCSFHQDAVAGLWSRALVASEQDGAAERKGFLHAQVWDFSRRSGLARLLSHVNQPWQCHL